MCVRRSIIPTAFSYNWTAKAHNFMLEPFKSSQHATPTAAMQTSEICAMVNTWQHIMKKMVILQTVIYVSCLCLIVCFTSSSYRVQYIYLRVCTAAKLLQYSHRKSCSGEICMQWTQWVDFHSSFCDNKKDTLCLKPRSLKHAVPIAGNVDCMKSALNAH